MSETTQTVATETNGAAAPAPAASGGAQEDNLDALLAQFEKPAEAKPAEAKPEPAKDSGDLRELADYVRNERQNKLRESARSDLENAVKAVRTELDDGGVKLPDRLVRGALRDIAEEDPRFMQAWLKRGENPKAWESVLRAAAKEVRKDIESSPDSHVTEDKAAVRAAVRSTSTGSPPAQDFDAKAWLAMTPAQRAAEKRKLGAG